MADADVPAEPSGGLPERAVPPGELAPAAPGELAPATPGELAPAEAPDAGTPDFDLLAARLRGERGDLAAFVEGLAAKLEESVPGLVTVERGRTGFRGPKSVRRITLDAGGDRLELIRDGRDRIETRRAKVSGGITLKTELIDIDAWLQTMSVALGVEAQRSEQTRQALERILLG